MRLTRVTFTGADDGVEPAELCALVGEFPFVEWGILLVGETEKRGRPRYPRLSWIDDFTLLTTRCSLHVCGSLARSILAGDESVWHPEFFEQSKRIQLNGFSDAGLGQAARLEPLLRVFSAHPNVEFICQVQGGLALGIAVYIAERHPNVSALWDPSGGRGTCSEWPPPMPGLSLRLGFAGGINPDNVVSVLDDLCARPGDDAFWIDMESGVRTDDRFDLDKVRTVLERAKPYVERHP